MKKSILEETDPLEVAYIKQKTSGIQEEKNDLGTKPKYVPEPCSHSPDSHLSHFSS